MTLDAVPEGFGINEKTYAITSFKKHTCHFGTVTDPDKEVTLTLKQRMGNRSMTSHMLSLLVRDEYHRASQSGQPWNITSPPSIPTPPRLHSMQSLANPCHPIHCADLCQPTDPQGL